MACRAQKFQQHDEIKMSTQSSKQQSSPKSNCKRAGTHTFRPSFSSSASFFLGSSTSSLYLGDAKFKFRALRSHGWGEGSGGRGWTAYFLMVFLLMIFLTAANLAPLLFAFPILESKL